MSQQQKRDKEGSLISNKIRKLKNRLMAKVRGPQRAGAILRGKKAQVYNSTEKDIHHQSIHKTDIRRRQEKEAA